MANTLDVWFSNPYTVNNLTSCRICRSTDCTARQKHGFCLTYKQGITYRRTIGTIGEAERFEARRTQTWILAEIQLSGEIS